MLSLLLLLLIALLLLLLLSTIIIIYFLFPSYFALLYLTAWSRLIYSSLCTWLFFWCILYFGVGGGGGGFVLGQFSFRAPESVTLRTTNGKKITIKNRQLPLATQAKYTLIDLSVQVRFTAVQNI